jgi:hypothetical protein
MQSGGKKALPEQQMPGATFSMQENSRVTEL